MSPSPKDNKKKKNKVQAKASGPFSAPVLLLVLALLGLTAWSVNYLKKSIPSRNNFIADGERASSAKGTIEEEFSWTKIKQAFAVLIRKDPPALTARARLAAIALECNDEAAALSAFDGIGK